jgi:hypothetical protein
VCVCVFVEVVLRAVLVFTQGAEKFMYMCRFVCGSGDSSSISFYTGCRKTNLGVFVEVVIVAV